MKIKLGDLRRAESGLRKLLNTNMNIVASMRLARISEKVSKELFLLEE